MIINDILLFINDIVVRTEFFSMSRFKSCCFLLVLALIFSGCGGKGDGRPPLAMVKGVITLDGKPFKGAFVTFIPENGRPSVGTSDAEGKYTLEYLQDVPGAAIGKHEVRIVTQSGMNEGDAVVERFPAKYNTKSTLTTEVVSGDNSIDFNLDSK